LPFLALLLLLIAPGVHAADLAGLAFVPSKQAPEVAVVDTRSDTVVRRLATGSAPLHAAVSESLGLLVTTSWRGNTVNLIDADGVLPTARVALDVRPDGIELDPAGRVLAVTSLESDRVALVDLAAGRQTASIPGFATPHHLAFSTDGKHLYVGNLGADRVTVVEVEGGIVARELELGAGGPGLGGVTNVTPLPDGKHLAVAFGDAGELALVDPAAPASAAAVRARIPVGELPWRAFATADGRRLVVPNNGEGTASVLDGATHREIARVPVGDDVTGVNFAWFESTAFVLSRGARKATVIDLESGTALGEIPLPGAPESGVTTPDGARVYVALGDTGDVAVVDARARRLLHLIEDVVRRPWGAQMAGASNYCR
jgi:DNA-binding beta-propeller fold protein YncE